MGDGDRNELLSKRVARPISWIIRVLWYDAIVMLDQLLIITGMLDIRE